MKEYQNGGVENYWHVIERKSIGPEVKEETKSMKEYIINFKQVLSKKDIMMVKVTDKEIKENMKTMNLCRG